MLFDARKLHTTNFLAYILLLNVYWASWWSLELVTPIGPAIFTTPLIMITLVLYAIRHSRSNKPDATNHVFRFDTGVYISTSVIVGLFTFLMTAGIYEGGRCDYQYPIEQNVMSLSMAVFLVAMVRIALKGHSVKKYMKYLVSIILVISLSSFLFIMEDVYSGKPYRGPTCDILTIPGIPSL